jgi:hypothetical protein
MTNLLNFENFSSVENAAYEVFLESIDDNITENKKSPVETALKNKSEKTGFPLGILRQVFNRGQSAWKKGHVPGTTPQQWGLARVNSFLVGGRTTKVSDGALYRQAKKNRKKKS